jgi:glutaredoxin
MLIVGLTVTVTVLFFTSQWRTPSEHDLNSFYDRTKDALDSRRGSGGAQILRGKHQEPVINDAKDKDGDGTIDEDDKRVAAEMADRLRAAEQKAKELANAKAPLKPDRPHDVVGVGSSAGGQNKQAVIDDKKADDSKADIAIRSVLDDIFKKSPGMFASFFPFAQPKFLQANETRTVVIFSKTYCPHSKRAKGILMEKYSIDPAPYVVELDEHPRGQELQAVLADMTGRKTVPNVMINKKSIGGADDTAELDARKTLIDKIKSLGDNKVSMKERFVDHATRRAGQRR